MEKSQKTSLWLSLILAFAGVYFWNSSLLLPVKFLTVFFHELSHGLAAIFTGGAISKIELDFMQGGLCYTKGGIAWIVVSAGYLGSLFWGCLILIANLKFKKKKLLMNVLSLTFLIATIVWVRNLEGIIICLLLALLFYVFPKYLNTYTCDVILNFIALTSCFYVIYDIKDDLIDRSIHGSDAMVLAGMLHVPGIAVGITWILIAILITYKTLSYALASNKK